MKKLNQKGFGAVEILLIVLLVGLIAGVGWYVWNNKQKNDKLNAISSFAECKAASDSKIQESYPETCVTKNGKSFTNPDQKVKETKTNEEVAPKETQKYITIKEWSVRVPYSGTDELSYIINSDEVTSIVSKELKTRYKCDKGGAGQIVRVSPSGGVSGIPIKDLAKEDPKSYPFVNGYYFYYQRDRMPCSDDVTDSDQAKANSLTKSIIPKIEAISVN